MQAHSHLPQQSPGPAQSRPPMQPISSGMPPPGMHVPAGMGPPPPHGPGPQPNGSMQHMPLRSLAPGQAHMPRQSRQPVPGQQQPQHHQPPPPSLLQQQPPPPHMAHPQGHAQPPPPPPQQQQSQSQSQPPQQSQPQPQPATSAQRLNALTEEVWLQIGSLSETMNDPERALSAYDNALRHNPYSLVALTQIANIYRGREEFEKAVEYFQRIVNADSTNGEIWGAIGNCYLMLDELQKAYQAYQQAIVHLPNPKEPKLWYGIGILYDRYGSYDNAEEAFVAVMKMDPSFDKATEIYFRLGIIHKCQGKYAQSLDCFNRILADPPKPLTETDIWFQIGNVHELNSEFSLAKDAYERVLRENPQHTKVLQQLGALYFRPSTSLSNIDAAVQLLTTAIELDKDKADSQTWYLLGRCYMAQQQYNKAYEAYQQAVYRDGNNANYWCSIGVLYYQINQYRDALDAYSRAIRINPYLSEVWFDLGALYEACNNQVNDAIDAYTRAAELDRSNPVIEQRLDQLRRMQASGQASLGSANPPPLPIDPPTATVTAGQPNAPGGPAGEAAVAGGAPGSLGAPPMSGAGHLPEHVPHAGDPSHHHHHPHPHHGGAAPTTPGMPQQYSQQQQQQQLQPRPPQSHHMHHHPQGPPGSARPGYAEDMGYGRYEHHQHHQQPPPPRGDVASAGPPMSGPYAPQGSYASGPYMHPSAAQQQQQHQQQQQQAHGPRQYSASGHPHAPEAYAPQAQPLSAGVHRPDGSMGSRHQSPAAPRQPQFQHHHHHHHQGPAFSQSTPGIEPPHGGATFQQGPMNGYGQHHGRHGAADGQSRSRSPSMPQRSPGYGRTHYTQPPEVSAHRNSQPEPAASQMPQEYGRTGSLPVGGSGGPAHQMPEAGPHPGGDADGDVEMEDSRPVAPGARGEHEVAPAPPPRRTSLAPVDPAASASGPPLAGPTAAPIRLPPVQFGGAAGGIASPVGRSSPLSVVGGAAQAAGGDVGRRASSLASAVTGAPTSLASAISAADDDKEGSAINSLMSLSGVASTLTAWPHQAQPQSQSQSASPQPSLPAKSGSESATVAAGRAMSSSDTPAVTNGVKEMDISSPQEASGDGQPVGAAVPPGAQPGEGGSGLSHEASPAAAAAAALDGEALAVVPSKRSLSTTNGGDTPTPTQAPLSGDAPRDSDGPEDSGGTSGDGDAPGDGDAWPRKRRHQGPGSPGSEKQQPAAEPRSEVEEGEEPEDGEVFDDEAPGAGGGGSSSSSSKSHKSDDIVDSGRLAP
ncbi:glucose repression mediator protein [Coemansia javaensis]|uniref:Glucose repression mediator protein n=1 Tax=Coemansia javaensis TaxID=2761396 RepID=A0A9W8HG08_9FUNG|nr:glucose repression mediator protein [Coemansia javaensis]